VSDRYYANIAVDWDSDRRAAAFAALDKHGLSDITTSEIAVSFERGQSTKREAFVRFLRDQGIPMTERRVVPWSTLTATVKDLYTKNKRLPAETLDAIGASITRIVKLKRK
jgi:hypothetical protein